MSFALNYILNSQWAMTGDALRTLVSLASRQPEIEALEKLPGQRPGSAQSASIRGGVAIIPVRGPLFKRANLMTEHCGATSYETLLRDFHQMIHAPAVQSIVFDIDSPGGEANGCSELCEHIFAARGQKPISAYIGGTGASAAYWIASACDQVFAADSAIVGSIGVQSAIRSEKADGQIRFVSSQSPNKNRDPASDEGALEVQAVIDGLAEVFVQKVAKNRGISREQLMDRYGQGSVFVGEEAKKRGLIDQISTLEDVIMNQENRPEITSAFIAEQHKDIAQHFIRLGYEEAKKEAGADVLLERQRICAIRALADDEVSLELCQRLIDQGASAESAALEILTELRKSGRKFPTPKPEDPRIAFDRHFSGLNIPPPEDRSKLDAILSESLAIARKSGAKIKE